MTVPKRFTVLRFIAGFLKVLAWITLVLSALAAIAVGVASSALMPLLAETGLDAQFQMVGGLGGIIAGIGVLLLGILYFLILYAGGESIQMQLAIEENTRLTAALLIKLDEESQSGSAAGTASRRYYGEVES